MRDLQNNIELAASIVPAVQSASGNGTGVDLQGADSATVVFNTGAVAGSGNFTASVEESDDNSAFTAVAAGDLLGTLTDPLAASAAYSVGYRGGKRYIRAVLTKNSGTSIAAGAVVVKGHLSQSA